MIRWTSSIIRPPMGGGTVLVEKGGEGASRSFDRGMLALLVVLGVGTAPLLWSILCTVPGVPWNPARLAPSFALSRGLPIYVLRDSGAHLGWFYGPMFPLWYLPVTWVKNITVAHMAAAVWNSVTLLTPVLLLLSAAGVHGRRLATAGAIGAVLLLGHEVMQDHFYYIHVDVVCYAFGLGGCLALYQGIIKDDSRWLHVAALALALAVWSKQLAVMLYPAAFCWVWRNARSEQRTRFLFLSLLYAAAVTALVFVSFGAEEVLFNTWLTHTLNPRDGGTGLLLVRMAKLIATCWPWLPFVGFVAWAWFRPTFSIPGRTGALMRLLLWAALWQLPLGLWATVKAGGGLNSVHSLHYAFCSALIVAAHGMDEIRRSSKTRVIAFVAIMALIPLANAYRLTEKKHWSWTPQRGQERLVEMARERPGKLYFPWNPIVSIIVDRRVQPLDNALYCLWLVGLEPPPEKIRDAVVRDPIIVFEERPQSQFVLRYFPELKQGPR